MFVQETVTDRPYCHITPEIIRPFPVAEPRVQKPGGRKRGKSSILTDTPVKNALAEAAQHAKKKRTDSSARKNLSNALSKDGSMCTTGNEGKKTAPRKSAPAKNALAEAAQHTKKKRADSSARKKLGNTLSKDVGLSMSMTGNKGMKTAPRKSATKKQTPKTREPSSAASADNYKKTVCLVCGESFEEDLVQCLECRKWAHANCTDGNDYYVCHNCDDLD